MIVFPPWHEELAAKRLVGIVVGLPAAMICVMALIGGATENGYARFLGALVLVLGLPLFVAPRRGGSVRPRSSGQDLNRTSSAHRPGRAPR